MTEQKTIQEQINLLISDVPTMKIPKRGRAKESFSDVHNSLKRAMIDCAFASSVSMTAAFKLGVKMFDRNCYICEEPIYDENYKALVSGIQADHIIPPSLGGSGSAGNLLPAHNYCNDAKGDQDFKAYFKARPDTIAKIEKFQDLCQYKPASKKQLNALLADAEMLRPFFEDIINKHKINSTEEFKLAPKKNAQSNEKFLKEFKNLNHPAYIEANMKSETQRKKNCKVNTVEKYLKSHFSDKALVTFSSEEFAELVNVILLDPKIKYWSKIQLKRFFKVILHDEAMKSIKGSGLIHLSRVSIPEAGEPKSMNPYHKRLF